ncbi:MAG: hypothetical protein QOJ37_1154, partial [Pseudonocardiales bacterium]|nr:hypothetical protein [Pseudonocardiales bacterium]
MSTLLGMPGTEALGSTAPGRLQDVTLPGPPSSLLVANRGEIAVRILRSAARLGLRTSAVYSEDDAAALHVRLADTATQLPGSGPAAYLDPSAFVDAARAASCTLLHPGYGFLSESSALAQACLDADLTFVGPAPDVLDRVGDKVAARQLAAELDVPVLRG